MEWLSPGLIVLIPAATVVTIVIGRRRHDPPGAIALNVIGFAIFLLGLNWAGNLGREAFLAAGAASLGALLFSMGAYQARAAERRPSASSTG